MMGYISEIKDISFVPVKTFDKPSPYYKVKPIMKRVSKEEFEKFLKTYPRPLHKDVTGICDPPYVTYNDFQLADMWPHSVVASTYLYDDNPDGFYYEQKDRRIYKIMENYNFVFANRTKKKGK